MPKELTPRISAQHIVPNTAQEDALHFDRVGASREGGWWVVS